MLLTEQRVTILFCFTKIYSVSGFADVHQNEIVSLRVSAALHIIYKCLLDVGQSEFVPSLVKE
ncbi:hypothetical protein DW249_11105 [Phocaeicola vulgatus]|nr:hypothetical protein DW249_11105 [Phocaeicola vulgatus]RHG82643.1 hypothetical protein DW240_10745 [Phocaeicola vulgatus]